MPHSNNCVLIYKVDGEELRLAHIGTHSDPREIVRRLTVCPWKGRDYLSGDKKSRTLSLGFNPYWDSPPIGQLTAANQDLLPRSTSGGYNSGVAYKNWTQ